MKHIQDRERDPQKQAGNARTLDTLGRLEADIHRVATSLGATPLNPPPQRIQMFDTYVPSLGGYSFFALTSMYGSHPGLGLTSVFADDSNVVNADRNQAPLMRAWLVAGQLRAFWHIARASSECLHLDLGGDQELAAWLHRRDNIDRLIADRFQEVTWGTTGGS